MGGRRPNLFRCRARSAMQTPKAICREFHSGDNYDHVLSLMTAQYLTASQAENYIRDALIFYCPDATGT